MAAFQLAKPGAKPRKSSKRRAARRAAPTRPKDNTDNKNPKKLVKSDAGPPDSGLDRALDILMMPEGIGFRKSGKVPRQTFNFAASGSCGNSDLVCSSHTPG